MAEELTQQTFFKALKSIDKFEGKCKLYVWLCQIAKNSYLAYLNKHKRLIHTDEIAEESTEREESFEAKLLISESSLEIHKVLHNLEEPYKEVFSLRIFGELSFIQIGEIFGKSESWARVTFFRAKLKIKEVIK